MTGIELKETTKRLGDAPLGKLLLSLSLPGIASMTTMALYNIIDTFWVARLGYRAIAALTVVMPFHVLVTAIGEGTGIGVSALTSRRFGERNVVATNHVAGQIFPLAILLGSIFLAAVLFFSHTILTICGATPDIMDYATQYLVIISFGTPFLIFSLSANNLLRGSGDAVRPMIFMIIATVINIILDPLMIFGIGPFPEMGVRGAALATTISIACSAGLSFYYIVAHKSIYRIKLAQIRLNLPILRDIYRVGLPAMIMETTESITFALFTYAISAFGSLAIAAAGLVIRISDLAFMPMYGVSEGLLPIVGFNFGAKLWDRVWRAVKLACIGIVLTMGVATVLLEIFTPQAVGIFSNDPELMALAVPAMRITLSSLVIVGPTILFSTTFQGLSKGKEALAIALIRQFLFFVPLLLLLPRIWGLNGAWLSWPTADALSFIVTGLWLLREYKLQKQKNL
ncbi:MAG: MATE family efflux transporter [Dehalococcoidia bacterium]|nr:MATE family efflux transporter [Dehalococcoidia bacterium]